MKRNRPARRRLLRPGEVATLFGVTTQTLRNWSRPGGRLADAIIRIPGARQFRYDGDKVDALMAKAVRGVA